MVLNFDAKFSLVDFPNAANAANAANAGAPDQAQ
jgi:hypothetical protein